MKSPREHSPKDDAVHSLPLLAMRSSVLFPHVLMPVSVGREKSLAAVTEALATDEKEILVVSQSDPTVKDPGQEDLYSVGTRAIIKQSGRAADGSRQLLIQGLERVAIIKVEAGETSPRGRFKPLEFKGKDGVEVEALFQELGKLVGQLLTLSRMEIHGTLDEIMGDGHDGIHAVYRIASIISLPIDKEQALLEASNLTDALRMLHTYLSHEVKVLKLRKEIASSAETEMDKQQREYLLRQQLNAIQAELGEKGHEPSEADELRSRMEKTELPDEVKKELERELTRLAKLPPASPDHGVIRAHVEFVLDLPWNHETEDHLDIAAARNILDEDHYGLEEIKERILEHLGVLKLNPGAKAPILCFVGPPGVGKTSLGRSIARALKREFERMSLGGLHDEAELRGHRRTYVGAMPGRILQAIRRAGARNPLIMLDEVDKLGRDFRGDPSSALLEVLDPEQNHEFRDNYLELPFDLSKVLFITTANSLDTVPGPLLDRMEVIRLEGYSDEEKFQIARRYLIPRQREEKGLTEKQVEITDAALRKIIRGYTREAGVRLLYRRIGKVVRKVALQIAEGKTERLVVNEKRLTELLGPEKFFLDRLRRELPVGVATGLAWTPTGGEVLYIEGTLLPKGKGLTLTGQLGEVMQESARAAHSYVWSHAAELDIDPDLFQKTGVHLHVPAGAIPKDGPSAGVTLAMALTSLYTNRRVRNDTAMSGEITLAGLVLPVGGIKEKVLAARRAGLRRLVLSKENQKDLHELPDDVQKEVEFVFVETIQNAIQATLEREMRPLKKVG